MMPVLIGAAGLASDTIQWTLTKRMMQRAADSGAIAGAYQLSQTTGFGSQAVRTAALGDITRNGGFSMSITPVINSPATSGSFRDASAAVEVILATDMNLPFTGLIIAWPDAHQRPRRGRNRGNGDYCVLALENTNTSGIPIGGNATVNLGLRHDEQRAQHHQHHRQWQQLCHGQPGGGGGQCAARQLCHRHRPPRNMRCHCAIPIATCRIPMSR